MQKAHEDSKYKSLFMSSRDAVMTLDPPSWKFTSGNPAAIKMFGARNEKEFLSFEPWKLSPDFQPDGRKSDVKAKEMVGKAMQEGTNFFEWTHKRINGEKFAAEVTLSRVEFAGKNFLHALVRDISERKQTEKLLYETYQLTESNKMLQQVIETIPVRIFWKDKDLNYLGCNTLFARDAGKKSSAELVGHNDFEMGWHDQAKLYRSDDQRVIDSGKPKLNYEEPQTTPSGKTIWLRTTKIPLCNLKNEIIGIMGTYEDITDRKKMENEILESKAQDESILASIGDAVFACDCSGKIVLFNKMAEKLTGAAASETIGARYQKAVQFVTESDGKPSNDFIKEAITANKITKMENHTMLVRRDGQKIPVADSAAPIKDANGDIIGCVVVFHDVTREREIDKTKTEFVSIASHQLRTPLTAINWYLEIILSGDDGKLNEKQRKHINETLSASRRMVNLVDTLLNVSRLELGTFAVEPKMVDIVAIAKTCIKEVNAQIVNKNLAFSVNFDRNLSKVRADGKLLEIIFQNLLTNAINYTPPQGRVELVIKIENDNILISVSDSGIGIPESQQEKIFSMLFRAENAKKIDPNGSGLGLYTVKEIVDHTGGNIWFKSSKQGTIFYVSFPKTGMVKRGGDKKLI